MEVGKAIYNILNTAQIQEGLGIYPEAAPPEAAYPYVVYSVQNIRPADVKGNTSELDEATLELYTISADYGECMEVSSACRAALDRNSGNFNGVQVQSISFETAEILYSEPQEAYLVEQMYQVRVLIEGQAPAANLLPLSASTIIIKESDGTPSSSCSTLVLPSSTLSVASGVATYSPVYSMGTFSCNSARLSNGQNPLDVSGGTAVRIPLEDEGFTYGNAISLTASGGYAQVAADGVYRITASVIFTADTHGLCPHLYLKVESRNLDGESGSMIPAQHGVDHQPANLSRVESMSSGERISLWAYDESNKEGSIYLISALIDVERMA